MTSRLTNIENASVWAAFGCAVIIAGFQVGKLGTRLAFPVPNQDFGGVETVEQFDNLITPAMEKASDTVAAVFGTPDRAAPAAEAPPPEMKQNTVYRLQGITVTGHGRWAMLISEGASFLVRAGDTLSNGDKVDEITASAVVLNSDGELTILAFSSPTASEDVPQNAEQAALMADFNPVEAKPEAPRVTTVTAVEKPSDPAEIIEVERSPMNLQALRKAIYAPNALSNVQFLRARVGNGGIGWQLKWIKDSPLVEAAGLQRGDVLVSINGVAITDAKGLQGLLMGLPKLSRIEIEYERKKRPMRAIIPLTES